MVRLVVKGYSQQERLDFIEIFSPVAKLVTVNTILAIAAINQWHFTQLDVNNTFQNRDLFEEIYMDLSLGYSKQSASNSWGENKLVCKPQKSIYVLKPVLRQWFSKFSSALISYVDNIIITSSGYEGTNSLKAFLHSQFKLKDLGPLKYFLCLEIARSQKGIFFLNDTIHFNYFRTLVF